MRDKIKLVSSAGTGHYYTTTKNKRLHPDKMETKKFDPVVRNRRLRWPIAKGLETALRKQTVRRVDRRAKYLLIQLDGGTLIVHLGMSGSLRMLGATHPPRAHDHWDIVLDSGEALRFHDPRRFGSLI